MLPQHKFGGSWTEEKLNRLKKYLIAYRTIFTRNPKAATLRTTYVDAFAGTGFRTPPEISKPQTPLLFDDSDAESFLKGSAQIVLEIEPSFDQFIFIDENPEHILELEKLLKQFPGKANRASIIKKEANEFVRSWCVATNWVGSRAVVFLDPYGMEVEWSTIEAIACTKAIDLWLLFPLGQAVNRLLTRDKPPEGAWADRLTRCFGTEDWKDAFYRPNRQGKLFDAAKGYEKKANFDSIGKFFINRLDTVFEKVSSNPLRLYNSRNVPIYLLCFAAGNPKGASTAVKIANDILRN